MLAIAALFARLLVPFLWAAAGVFVVLFAILLLGRAWTDLRARQRERVASRCRPLVEALLLPTPRSEAIEQLMHESRPHQLLVGRLLIKPARFAAGTVIDQLRAAAGSLGILDRWVRELSDRR